MIDRGIMGALHPFIKDGDLLATIHVMLGNRGPDSVNVSKVTGHADQFMVDDGSVRQDDLTGTVVLRLLLMLAD